MALITYQWKGINPKGRKIKGEFEAETTEQVRSNLEQRNIKPIKIKKKPKDLFESIEFLRPKVKEEELIVFSRQLATMIDAGLPLLQCLEILYQQQTHSVFKQCLRKIKESVESGETFADSLRQFPQVFNTLYVNMVAAGEAGGILDVILD
ncbi:MAG: type II secretion system F family protein, partial [Desulfovibrionales bacterium]|nr:type II secretion system F family protein [Desulfovibrionales bacterium]